MSNTEVVKVRHRSLAPVMVIGHERSGTSLLIRLLRQYLRIAFGTESQFIIRIKRQLPYYGDLSNKENQKRLIRSICRERWFKRCQGRFGFTTNHQAILDDVTQNTYRGVLDAVFGQLAKHLQMTRWGDKTPEYLHHLKELYELFPDAQYIHIVRDGRDVALSNRERHFGQGNFVTAALNWKHAIIKVEEFKSYVKPEQFLEIRYEDLLSFPEETFLRLIDFLHIEDPDGRLLEHIAQHAPQEIRQSNHGKWRRLMSPAAIRQFDEICCRELLEYGYTASTTHPVIPSSLMISLWNVHHYLSKLTCYGWWLDNLYKLGLRTRSLLERLERT